MGYSLFTHLTLTMIHQATQGDNSQHPTVYTGLSTPYFVQLYLLHC